MTEKINTSGESDGMRQLNERQECQDDERHLIVLRLVFLQIRRDQIKFRCALAREHNACWCGCLASTQSSSSSKQLSNVDCLWNIAGRFREQFILRVHPSVAGVSPLSVTCRTRADRGALESLRKRFANVDFRQLRTVPSAYSVRKCEAKNLVFFAPFNSTLRLGHHDNITHLQLPDSYCGVLRHGELPLSLRVLVAREVTRVESLPERLMVLRLVNIRQKNIFDDGTAPSYFPHPIQYPSPQLSRLHLSYYRGCSSEIPRAVVHLFVGGDWMVPSIRPDGLDHLPPALQQLHVRVQDNNHVVMWNFPPPPPPLTLHHLPATLTLLNFCGPMVDVDHLPKDHLSDLRMEMRVPSTAWSMSQRQFDDGAKWFDRLADFSHLTRLHVTFRHFVWNSRQQLCDHLPSTLTHLHLEGVDLISVDHLPPSLQVLCLGDLFNCRVDHLPHGLLQLNLGDSFNLPVDHLPSSLLRLTLGHLFNQPIDHLPPALQRLSLGNSFDQRVDHLPPVLERLTFSAGGHFNQSVDHLPGALSHLILGAGFNRPLDHLPPAISVLRLGASFSQSLIHVPSDGLVFLDLSDAIRSYYYGDRTQTWLNCLPSLIQHFPHTCIHTGASHFDLLSLNGQVTNPFSASTTKNRRKRRSSK